jgi:putative transposase
MRVCVIIVGVGGRGYLAGMSRFRMLPTPAQQVVLLEHCRHARFVWNLAVEQQQFWQPGRRAPGYNEQSAQLTEIRIYYDWLAAGSQTVQQQALRDFAQAMRNFFAGTHGRPSWRKAGVHEGFRQVGVKSNHIEKLNRRYGRVWVPKVGWVRFRRSRAVPQGVKSYRITCDRAGRWHVAFAHIPNPIGGPGDGSVVGVDRGVAVSAALSTGELLHAPSLTPGEWTRLRRLQQRLTRAKRGSNRRQRTRAARLTNPAFGLRRSGASTAPSVVKGGVGWLPAWTIRLRADLNGSRLRTRRNDAAPVGTSRPKTARAKRSSRASPVRRGRATPT